nr:hypothetical protein [Abalone asfa-like virus]
MAVPIMVIDAKEGLENSALKSFNHITSVVNWAKTEILGGVVCVIIGDRKIYLINDNFSFPSVSYRVPKEFFLRGKYHKLHELVAEDENLVQTAKQIMFGAKVDDSLKILFIDTFTTPLGTRRDHDLEGAESFYKNCLTGNDPTFKNIIDDVMVSVFTRTMSTQITVLHNYDKLTRDQVCAFLNNISSQNGRASRPTVWYFDHKFCKSFDLSLLYETADLIIYRIDDKKLSDEEFRMLQRFANKKVYHTTKLKNVPVKIVSNINVIIISSTHNIYDKSLPKNFVFVEAKTPLKKTISKNTLQNANFYCKMIAQERKDQARTQ